MIVLSTIEVKLHSAYLIDLKNEINNPQQIGSFKSNCDEAQTTSEKRLLKRKQKLKNESKNFLAKQFLTIKSS